MLAIANRNDGAGVALFGGLKADAPFTKTPTGVVYAGNDQVPQVQVAAGQSMANAVSGAQVFQSVPTAGGGTQSVFKTYEDLIATLSTPITDAASRNALVAQVGTAGQNLDNAYQIALQAQVMVGTRQAELAMLDTNGGTYGDQLKAAISQLESVDALSAISLFTQQQVSLEAAQRAFVSMQKLSLFQYL